jgi:hypothetical protein
MTPDRRERVIGAYRMCQNCGRPVLFYTRGLPPWEKLIERCIGCEQKEQECMCRRLP